MVTGGAGFIGSHLVERLVRDGHDVEVIDNFESGFKSRVPKSVRVSKVDIVNAGKVRDLVARLRPNALYHLAASAKSIETHLGWRRPRRDFEVNAYGTLNILRAVASESPECPVVFTSSAAVYGDQTIPRLAEGCVPRPISPYGASKLAAESYIHAISRYRGISSGILRVFNVYGPHQRRYVVFDLWSKARKGLPIEILGTGKEVRDFIYVDDAVGGLRIAEKLANPEAPVYNLCTGRGTSITDLARLILALSGHDPKAVRYKRSDWPGNLPRLVGDGSRLEKEANFRPRTALDEGVAKCLRDWTRRVPTQATLT